MSLREVGINEDNLEAMARAAVNHNKGEKIGSFKPLDYEDILEIFKMAL